MIHIYDGVKKQIFTHKSYVRNKSHPKGSITEEYILENVQPFVQDICMMLKRRIIMKKGITSLQIT